MDPVFDVSDLSVEFRTARGRIKALRNVSFSVQPGRIVGIVGESGSGKSTVLWSILDLLASNAVVTGGKISFEGRDMLTRSTKDMLALRSEDVSVVFQDPMTSQIPVLPYARQMRDILYRRDGLGDGRGRAGRGAGDAVAGLVRQPHTGAFSGLSVVILHNPNCGTSRNIILTRSRRWA